VVKALKSSVLVYATEVETAAPLAASLKAGSPQVVDYKPSFVDGIGSKTVFPRMFKEAQELLDGSIVVTLQEAAAAIKLVSERNRVIMEARPPARSRRRCRARRARGKSWRLCQAGISI